MNARREAVAKAIYEAHPALYYLDDTPAAWEDLAGLWGGKDRIERANRQAEAALRAADVAVPREGTGHVIGDA